MTERLDDFEYAEPATLLGQLQRGRGVGAVRALSAPGAGDLVYECVIRDTRWDKWVESRDHYLAGLIHRLDLPVDPIANHLLDGAAHVDVIDVGLSLQVLGCLVRLGRVEAAPVLRRYAVEGEHWEAALDAVPDWGASELWSGLDAELLPRLDDEQLAAVACNWDPWLSWASAHPRLQRILDSDAAARKSRPEPERLEEISSAELVDRIRLDDGTNRRRELLALASRGELVVLDLAEDVGLRATGAMRSIHTALRNLGAAAVARARDWADGGDEELRSLAVSVLARSGDRSDAPVLMDALATALTDEDWCGLEDVAVGLGRLAVGEAGGLLVKAWESTVHSYSRISLFQGLAGCLPAGFDHFAVEGLDDCEESVQEAACAAAPIGAVGAS